MKKWGTKNFSVHKVFIVIATLFIMACIIAGFLGMNFDNM